MTYVTFQHVTFEIPLLLVMVTTEEERGPGLVMTTSDDNAENTRIGAACLSVVFVIFCVCVLADIPLVLLHLRNVSALGQMLQSKPATRQQPRKAKKISTRTSYV